MDDVLLTVAQAAERLGVRPTTLYDWLSQSDYGLLNVRGRRIVVNYLQGGPKGRGRIRIAASEVERLKESLRVVPCALSVRPAPQLRRSYPGITVPLGRPRS